MGTIAMLPKVVSLIAVVLLVLWLFFFMFGGLPLLILKYVAALDAHFVRGFYNIHYLGLMGFAVVGALSSSVSERVVIAVASLMIGLISFGARRVIVAGMDRLRDAVMAADALAIRGFRQLHVQALVLNAALLGGFITIVSVASASLENM